MAGAVAPITGVVDIGMVLRCDIDVFSVRYQGHLPHARTARRIPESLTRNLEVEEAAPSSSYQ